MPYIGRQSPPTSSTRLMLRKVVFTLFVIQAVTVTGCVHTNEYIVQRSTLKAEEQIVDCLVVVQITSVVSTSGLTNIGDSPSIVAPVTSVGI